MVESVNNINFQETPPISEKSQKPVSVKDKLKIILSDIKPQNIKSHVLELSRSSRPAYQQDTQAIEKAQNYILNSLRKSGLPENQKADQKGVSMQQFTMQRQEIIKDVFSPPVANIDQFLPAASPDKTLKEEAKEKQPSPRLKTVERVKQLINDSYYFESFSLNSPYRIEKKPRVAGNNIIVRISGSIHPEKKIILSAHFDSAVNSPGANDNATGVACLLEAARVFSANKFENTIEIVFFTAEEEPAEDFGSRFYLQQLAPAEKENILGVFVVDMIGNNQKSKGIKKPENLNLLIDRDNPELSKPLAEAVQKTMSDLVPGFGAKISPDFGGDSDDDEFQKENIPTVLVISDEVFNREGENKIFNTPKDTADKIDFDYFLPKAVQSVIAAVAAQAIPI